MEGEARFHLDTSHHRPGPLVTRCDRATPRGVARSMTSRRRSPRACSRRSPAHPVRCAPPQHGASIVTTGAPWRTCPGRSIGCAQLRVRKWFCRNRRCRRRIFTERLPTIAAPWARRTLRLAQRLIALGRALGERGVQLGHVDVVMSRNTSLRGPASSRSRRSPRPGCLGWMTSPVKTAHHGTILVDLERRQPVALLPERTAEPLAQWLREHPGVEVIARDRASAYAEGADRHGASAATQVADRFHVLQNLRETLDEVFTTHHDALTAVNAARHQQPVPLPDGTLAVPVPPPPIPARAEQQAAQRAAQRQARYEQIDPPPPGLAERGHCRPGGLQPSHHRAVSAPADVAGAAASPPLWTQHPQPVSGLSWSAERRLPHRHPTVSGAQLGGLHRAIAVTAHVSRIRQAQGIPPRRQGRRQLLLVVAEPVSQP